MFCAYTRPRYQVSIYRTIGPLVFNIFVITVISHFCFKGRISALLVPPASSHCLYFTFEMGAHILLTV